MKIETQNTGDQELLEGILNAERLQIERLYGDCLPGIIRYIKMNNGTEDDAKDIFQDAVMVIYKKLKSSDLVLSVSLQSYLIAICRNLWLTTLRDNRFMKIVEAKEDSIDDDEDIITAMETVQKEKIFNRHFEKLGDQCRKILRLFFEKVSMKEIAGNFNTSESYIKKRKFMCKEQLTKAIKNDPAYKALQR